MGLAMRIIEETAHEFEIECNCGGRFTARKGWGVLSCSHCGRSRDPRRLKYKWARDNSPETPNACQAL